MRSSKAWIGLPLLIALAACGGDADDTEVVQLDDQPQEVMPPATEPGMDSSPAMDAGTGQTAMFEPLGDSGVSGEATITDRGQQTEVMVRLTGASGAGEHPGHIHNGTCDNIGGVVQPLDPINTDATGTGTMTTTVDVAPMTAMDGQHLIAYHTAGGGPPITCAEIPTHTM